MRRKWAGGHGHSKLQEMFHSRLCGSERFTYILLKDKCALLVVLYRLYITPPLKDSHWQLLNKRYSVRRLVLLDSSFFSWHKWHMKNATQNSLRRSFPSHGNHALGPRPTSQSPISHQQRLFTLAPGLRFLGLIFQCQSLGLRARIGSAWWWLVSSWIIWYFFTRNPMNIVSEYFWPSKIVNYRYILISAVWISKFECPLVDSAFPHLPSMSLLLNGQNLSTPHL